MHDEISTNTNSRSSITSSSASSIVSATQILISCLHVLLSARDRLLDGIGLITLRHLAEIRLVAWYGYHGKVQFKSPLTLRY